MTLDTNNPSRAAGPNLLGSACVSAGLVGVLFWVPLVWAIHENRHSLQLSGETQLLASALLFLLPVVVLAAGDHLLAGISARVHRWWRYLLFATATAWVLLLNAHFENNSFIPALALATSLFVLLWLVSGVVRHLAPTLPRWSRLLVMLVASVLFAGYVHYNLLTVPYLVAVVLFIGLARALGARALKVGTAMFEAAGVCAVLISVAFVAYGFWTDFDNARNQGDESRVDADSEGKRGPVFIFVFDGMAREAIVDDDGRILDRFPTLQRLAQEGIWIRDATTNFDHTSESIPSMLLGRFEETYRLSKAPSLFEHVESEYTSHVRGVVINYCTAFSRSSVGSCLDQRHYFRVSDTTDVTTLLLRVFAGTLPSAMRPTPGPPPGLYQAKKASVWLLENLAQHVERQPLENSLFFTHVLTPHTPFVLGPNGAMNVDKHPQRFDAARTPEELAAALENYRLEIEYDDRYLARMIRTLESRGLWQDTTMIVTADHGYAWEWHTRKWGSGKLRNLVTEQIARIPVFIKPASSVQVPDATLSYRPMDLIPTVLDLVGMAPLPDARIDGQSAFSRQHVDEPLEVISTTGRPWIFDQATQQWRERAQNQAQQGVATR